MKVISTFSSVPLIIGLSILAAVLNSSNLNGYSVFECRIAFVGVLAAALIAGTLLNFAMFAPVYWLLGRLQPKAIKPGPKPNLDS